jgi:uncharacterized protein YjbI with pentapeptide repeats
MAGHQDHRNLNSSLRSPSPEERTRNTHSSWRWTGFRDKTLWNVLELLVLPVSLLAGIWLLNSRVNQQQAAVVQRQTEEQQQVAQLAVDRAQQDTLDRYIDEMSSAIDRGLLTSTNPQQRDIARARTLFTLRSLDRTHKALLLQFIYDAGLITDTNTVISLSRAELTGINLNTVFLPQANLRETFLTDANFLGAELQGVNFSVAELSRAGLSDTFLFEANLSRAQLSNAKLQRAILVRANLSGADLNNADLSGAFLVRANLRGANLRGANLRNANLNEANLSSANLDDTDLSQAFLCNTIMPNGAVNNRDCR